MKKKITIAIDGWSSCGKSTLAKALAKSLGYIYVDSGAMYRGIALFALRNGWVTEESIDKEKIIANLNNIDIHFENTAPGKADLYLNGENVEDQIRNIKVSNVVSPVATIKEVREHLVKLQRALGESGGVVMDGRDIGSVVFPNAELKLFLTAKPEIRAQRRLDELIEKGEDITYDQVKTNLEKRDEMDSKRKESPLIQTSDAIVVDNSGLTTEEQLNHALMLVKETLKTVTT
ncbi:MAG: (d)CMP kinase [Brumimicrobium sp.]|nr:(d)CMP kinase [Brumimicrobium sp.]